MKRGVKITGLGLVTPAGIGKQCFLKGILSGQSFVSSVTRFPKEAGPFVASEIKRFRLDEYYSVNGAEKRLPRHTQFAIAATILAIEDAGLQVEEIKTLAPVVITGTSLMDSEVINKTIENVARKGPRYGLSRVVFHGPVASISATVANILGGARTLSLQSACCSGADAIGHAAAIIANGEADIAICGGTEAPIYYHPMLELKMADLSPSTDERPEQLCRPFDLWRTTGVIGEGAAVMVLEPLSSPRRGYANVAGYSFATDPLESPGKGMYSALSLCLANSGIRPSQVDMISAWGPGHREIDAIETSVLRELFREEIDRIPTVSIKGSIGNPFAAAGAIQVACAALGISESFVPPTVNWSYPDPSCLLNLSASARFLPIKTAVINSHGLSGTNAALALSRCE